MAINKTKVLAQADKYIAKQNYNKALNELLKVEKATPSDIHLLNKIGDLYSQIGNAKDAIAYFSRVAEAHRKGGFNLKAIAVLKKVVRIDDRYMDARDRLVELYTQQGHHSEAKAELRRMADHYLNENLLARALTCFEKILNLDASNLEARIRMAELLVREGRKDDAIHHFVVMGRDLLQKNMINEAQKIIGQGLKIAGKNPALQTLLAKCYLAEGKADEAVEQLTQICREHPNDLEAVKTLGRIYFNRGQLKDANACFLRALHVSEDEVAPVEDVARKFIERGELDEACRTIQPLRDIFCNRGQYEEAIRLYRNVLYVDESHLPSLDALGAIYAESGQTANAVLTLEKLIGLHQDQHNREAVQAAIERLLAVDPNNAEWGAKLEALTGKSAPQPEAEPAADHAFGDDEEDDDLVAPPAELAEAEGPAGDVENRIANHLTEAEISLKYGIVDQAIQHLQAVKEIEFLHLEANRKLQAIFLERGEVDQAVGCMVCLINASLESNDFDAARNLVEEIEKHRPDIAQIHRNRLEATLNESMPPSESSLIEFQLDAPAGSESVGVGFEVSDDLDVVDFSKIDQPAESMFEEASPAEEQDDSASAGWSLDMPRVEEEAGPGKAADLQDLFLDQAGGAQAWDQESSLRLSADSDAEPPLTFESLDDAPEVEEEAALDFSEEEAPSEPQEEAPAEPEEMASDGDAPQTTEAESEVPSIEEAEPESPGPSLDEVDFADLELPELEDEAEPPPAEAVAEEEAVDEDATLPTAEVSVSQHLQAIDESERAEAVDEEEIELDTDPDQRPDFSQLKPEPTRPAPLGSEQGSLASELEEIDFFISVEAFEDAAKLLAEAVSRFGDHPLLNERLQEVESKTQTQAKRAGGSKRPESEDELTDEFSDDGGLFDLAAELSDALFDDEQAEEINDNTSQEEFQSVEELFQEFKKGVEEQIDKDDFQTHYDLGIAYKEMGLLEEAMAEFQIAVRDPKRFLECVAMIGNCLVELGRPEEAVAHYQQALAKPDLSEEARTALTYDLAQTFEGLGELEKALDQFQNVERVDPQYRDVAVRIDALR